VNQPDSDDVTICIKLVLIIQEPDISWSTLCNSIQKKKERVKIK
jgi:hypothetical protein